MKAHYLGHVVFYVKDLERSLAFYRDRFADAGDFTFVFVGTFEPERIRPLLERYLGSLPSLGREESWIDRRIDPPTGVIERTVRKAAVGDRRRRLRGSRGHPARNAPIRRARLGPSRRGGASR